MEVLAGSELTVVTGRSYNALLGFGGICLREGDADWIAAVAKRPMRLRRIFFPPSIRPILEVEAICVGDRCVLVAAPIPGELFGVNEDMLDEIVGAGDRVKLRVRNLSRMHVDLAACGLGDLCSAPAPAGDPNAEVTAAIMAAEDSIHSAIAAWAAVELCEMRLTKAEAGVGSARTVQAVLRSLVSRG